LTRVVYSIGGKNGHIIVLDLRKNAILADVKAHNGTVKSLDIDLEVSISKSNHSITIKQAINITSSQLNRIDN